MVQRDVIRINEHCTVLEAAVLMTEKYVGSVVVDDSKGIKGIFTERDLMMQVVGKKKDPGKVEIKDVMSRNLIKITPDDTWPHCLDLMKEKRCRHLLVFDGDEFYGILSLRDLVSLLIDEKEELITQLEKYISGSY
jgi:CBS domain-containing protein